MSDLLSNLRAWPSRRWVTAAATALLTVVVVAVPTDLINTPWFSRDVPVTWWAWPVLIVTATLAGLVTATYVRTPVDRERRDRQSGASLVGGVLSFFAVGCPVCNKLVLLALGTSGAMTYFEPLQPVLAALSLALLAWALVVRVRKENACAVRPRSVDAAIAAGTDSG